MGIRLKLAVGFAILTVVIVSSVSFWAAQSLGFSIDISDFQKLSGLKNRLTAQLEKEGKALDQTVVEVAQAFVNLSLLGKPRRQQEDFIENLKSNLSLDWLEVFQDEKAVYNSTLGIKKPEKGLFKRLSRSGPFSNFGYICSESRIDEKSTLIIARRPDFSRLDVPGFCFFDNLGILQKHNLEASFDFFNKLATSNVSGELRVNDEVFRVRTFKLEHDLHVATAYPSQRTTISRPDIDGLMLRLALLQVIGLLLLGFFLGRKVLEPLQALGNSMEKVAQGEWKEIDLNQPPIVNSGYEIESVAQSFNRMVKELTLAQSRLIEVQKELAKKDKLAALGRFSAGIAHEINNPLGTILANAGLIKESISKGHPVEPDEIEEIVSEVKRCKNIIATLRTYTSKTRPRLEVCNFASAFVKLVEFIRGDDQFREILIESSGNIEAEIELDVEAMKQVFFNLSKNAVEAANLDIQPILQILVRQCSDHIEIKFRDNGVGFSCEPELIFEPLFTTKAQGTGLGLIICQAIIEGHGGRIFAGRVENFTEITIQLPLKHISEQKTGETDET